MGRVLPARSRGSGRCVILQRSAWWKSNGQRNTPFRTNDEKEGGESDGRRWLGGGADCGDENRFGWIQLSRASPARTGKPFHWVTRSALVIWIKRSVMAFHYICHQAFHFRLTHCPNKFNLLLARWCRGRFPFRFPRDKGLTEIVKILCDVNFVLV